MKDIHSLNEFDLDFESLDTFKFILDSIYGQKIDLSQVDSEKLINITKLAKRLELKELGMYSEKSLEQFVDKKTAKRLALYAVKNDLPELKKKCIQVIATYPELIEDLLIAIHEDVTESEEKQGDIKPTESSTDVKKPRKKSWFK
jgi:hypothetical protein